MGGDEGVARLDRTSEIRSLVFSLAKELSEQVRSAVGGLELTTTQANVLRDLVQPMTQRELADSLVCEPSNVTFVVDRLEKRGLVERLPHATDRRSKVLHLTRTGVMLRAEMIDRFESMSPLSNLTEDELDQLEVLLRRATSSRT